MKTTLSRRRLLISSGCGVLGLIGGSAAGRAFSPGQTAIQRLLIDRSGAKWGNRPMFLRPYHPPYIVAYYGRREGLNSAKWSPLISRVANEPDLRVRIIEAFDDACAGCPKLEADPMGSVWGVGHTCSSAKDPAMVEMVTRTNKRILGELGFFFGAEMRLKDLVPLLQKQVPRLYQGIGGAESQADYEKGLRDLVERYGL
ncbi:MAG: hypothetical protein A2W03_14780 [Candidatus Aminicenantes bacterium RBG_16_63_16]|nr:MAG: hypothetical protein A2W03_14780 [Candidatus Aminicenantes bacterium RBG_16_63_16]